MRDSAWCTTRSIHKARPTGSSGQEHNEAKCHFFGRTLFVVLFDETYLGA